MPPKHRSKSTAPRSGTQPSHGPASPSEQAPSTLSTDELSMALIEALSSEDVINKLNRDSINYARITNEVTKRIKLIVDPLLNKFKEKDLEMEDLKAKYNELNDRCDDLKQYSRKNSLRISGVPEKKDEDVFSIVLDISKNQLKLDPPIRREDISNCHRVGSLKTDGSHRHILFKFMTYQVRY